MVHKENISLWSSMQSQHHFLPRIRWGMKEHVPSEEKQGIINAQGSGFYNKMYHTKASYSLGRNHDLQINFYEHKCSFYYCSQSSHYSQATVESLWLQLPKHQEGQNYILAFQRAKVAFKQLFYRIIEQCGWKEPSGSPGSNSLP